ncbi:hypothetical protein BKA67DRAFT_656518 [Truncatella angustata]|uniref:Cytochrome c oxidase assembly protein n=1 Tax=Truncatella angustata TaxID=152316 RepID=A0A9P8UTZ0_9PEZI|nr:uncharacterized protein BKA67DRAFT_656518 [Truncatella angustata]KAH6658319.1 hypothetical protein BKA67DRAFT_656518 [Truncatella angustata]
MSTKSKLTLLGTSLFAVTTVVFVHFQQKWEGDAMHQGVIRDMEQQRIKKERQLDFDMQKALEQEYKKEQSVQQNLAELEPPKRAQGRYH